MEKISLRYLNVMLTILTIVLGLNIAVQLGVGPAMATNADAAAPPRPGGIPDEGAQRHEMISHLKAISTKLDTLNTTLTSGKAKVKVELPKQKK